MMYSIIVPNYSLRLKNQFSDTAALITSRRALSSSPTAWLPRCWYSSVVLITVPAVRSGRPTPIEAVMALLGDANKDKKVSVSDVVSIVNHILGIPSEKFNEKAADVNKDKAITVTDAVGVVNIILGSGGAGAPQMK